jgi:hypothetical protein
LVDGVVEGLVDGVLDAVADGQLVWVREAGEDGVNRPGFTGGLVA